MLGNTFGRMFQVTTCGEIYGWHATAETEGYGGSLLTIVNGVPPGIKLDVQDDPARAGQAPPRPEQAGLARAWRPTASRSSAACSRASTTGAPVGHGHPQRRYAGHPHRAVPRRSRT